MAFTLDSLIQPKYAANLDTASYDFSWENNKFNPDDPRLNDVRPLDLIHLMHESPQYSLYLLLISNTICSLDQLNQLLSNYDLNIEKTIIKNLKKLGILYSKNYRVYDDYRKLSYKMITYYKINPKLLPQIISAAALIEHMHINKTIALDFLDVKPPTFRFANQISFISVGYKLLINLSKKDRQIENNSANNKSVITDESDFIKITGGLNDIWGVPRLLNDTADLFFQVYIEKGYLEKLFDDISKRYIYKLTEKGNEVVRTLQYCLNPFEILGFKTTDEGFKINRLIYDSSNIKFRTLKELDTSIKDAIISAMTRIKSKQEM